MTLRNFKMLIVSCAATLALFSCHNDDDNNKVIIPGPPTGTDIRYQVSTTADIITIIRYTNDDEIPTNGELLEDFRTDWSKTIIVPFELQPFTAHLQAGFLNNTGTDQTFTLSIYKDGAVVKTLSGVIPTADSDPETDDNRSANIQYLVSQ